MRIRLTKLWLVLCMFGLLVSTATAQDTLKVGDKAPDFEIETFGSETIKLSDRFNDDGQPTILLFSRASW